MPAEGAGGATTGARSPAGDPTLAYVLATLLNILMSQYQPHSLSPSLIAPLDDYFICGSFVSTLLMNPTGHFKQQALHLNENE